MKKLIISMGLAAAGTASLQAAYAPDATGDTSKIWAVSATLRNFYDDNYTTAPSGPGKKGSYGVQISPQFEVNAPMGQTELGARYIYGMSYYQERENLGQSSIDQTHQFDLWVDHTFTERWQARVQDSFVAGQEPELINPAGTAGPTLQRVKGNNIVNTAKISVTTDWTQLLSTVLSYQNTLYDYQNSGGTAASPSLAGLLNRDQNLVSLDFQFHVLPTTTGFFGYKYGQVIYDGNEPIAAFGPTIYTSSSRDTRSHYGYVGVTHSFLDNLTGTASVGVQYTEYYNDPSASTSVGPYANASLLYSYAAGSYAQIGLTHRRNATSQVALDASGNLTLDQESTVVYGSINQKLTPKLTASAVADFQDSSYNGGLYNGQTDDFYSFGLNFNYVFTHNFSMDAGYNFDDSVSKAAGQSYTRNRVYVGVTASY